MNMHTVFLVPTRVAHNMLTVYEASWLGSYADNWLQSQGPVERLFFTFFTLTQLVVMLNLLIAIIQDSFKRVKSNEVVTSYKEKAKLLEDIEGSLPEAMKKDQKLFPYYLMVGSTAMSSASTIAEPEPVADEKPLSGCMSLLQEMQVEQRLDSERMSRKLDDLSAKVDRLQQRELGLGGLARASIVGSKQSRFA